MGMTSADYLAQLQALLPQGPAWPRESDATLTRLLQAWADELARVDSRAAQLIDEADPRTTFELLSDWERVAGLPDPCAGEDQSTAQRRAALHARLTTLGGQSAAYYIGLAANLGYVISITEFHEHTVNDDVDYPIYAQPWPFAWQVNAPLNTIGLLSVGDTVDDPLAWWGNELLECLINRLKPAHTHVLFAYS
jgi:uncharacterized protein YmfQ (DUF2313 family)